MSYEFITAKSVLAATGAALSSLALWVINGQVKRIDSLEEDMQQVKESKLNRDEYSHEQENLRSDIKRDMNDIRDKIERLPQQIITLLKDTGNI